MSDEEAIVETNLPKKYHFDDPPKVDKRTTRRPNLYTDGRKKKILMAFKAGATEKYAAGYAGISLETLRRWRTRGTESSEDSVGVDKDMFLFAQACLEANANNALFLLQKVLKGAEEDPDLALKALTVLHPAEYGQKNGKLKVEGQIDHVHQQKLSLEN